MTVDRAQTRYRLSWPAVTVLTVFLVALAVTIFLENSATTASPTNRRLASIESKNAADLSRSDGLRDNMDRSDTRLSLHLRVSLDGDQEPRPAAGCNVSVRGLAGSVLASQTPEDLIATRSFEQNLVCDQSGQVTLQLPADCVYVKLELHHTNGDSWLGDWRRGQPMLLEVVLNPCGIVAVTVIGDGVPSGFLLVKSPTASRRMSVPFNSRRAEIRGIPVAWSPVRIVLRSDTGSEYSALTQTVVERSRVAEATIDVGRLAGTVRGRLVTPALAPIKGADVLIFEASTSSSFRQASTSTDQAGDFLCHGLPRSKLAVSISAPGYARTIAQADLTNEQDCDLGQIVANVGRSIRGIVGAASRDVAKIGGVMPIEGEEGWGLANPVGAMSGWKTTVKSDWSFSVDRLPPGRYLVWVSNGEGLWEQSWGGRVVELGNATLEVDELVLGTEHTWDGKFVRNTQDQWPAGSRAIAMGLDQPWWSSGAINAEGQARLSLGRGNWLVGYVSGGSSRWLRRMQEADPSNLLLEPLASVLLVSTTPIRNDVLLRLEWLCDPVAPKGVGRQTSVSAVPRSSYQWSIPNLSPGSYRIHAFVDRRALDPVEFSIQDGQSLWIEWPDSWR